MHTSLPFIQMAPLELHKHSAMSSVYLHLSLCFPLTMFVFLCLIQYRSVCWSVGPPQQSSLLYRNGWIVGKNGSDIHVPSVWIATTCYCDISQHLQGKRFIYHSGQTLVQTDSQTMNHNLVITFGFERNVFNKFKYILRQTFTSPLPMNCTK